MRRILCSSLLIILSSTLSIISLSTILNATEFNFQGNLPIHQAIKDSKPHIQYGTQTYIPPNAMNAFNELLKDKQNLNARNEWGMTPLIVATANNRPDMVATLLDQGADINAQDREGDTALYIAASGASGLKPIMELLVAKGADPTIKNKHGKSAEPYVRNYQLQKEVEAQSQKINMVKDRILYYQKLITYKKTPPFGKKISSGDIVRLRTQLIDPSTRGQLHFQEYIQARDSKYLTRFRPMGGPAPKDPSTWWEVMIDDTGNYISFESVSQPGHYIIIGLERENYWFSFLGSPSFLPNQENNETERESNLWAANAAFLENDDWKQYGSLQEITNGSQLVFPREKNFGADLTSCFIETVKAKKLQSSPKVSTAYEEKKLIELQDSLALETANLEKVKAELNSLKSI